MTLKIPQHRVDYLATDWLVLSGGKFLTPFNTWGPRLHPGWINKLTSPPPTTLATGL